VRGGKKSSSHTSNLARGRLGGMSDEGAAMPIEERVNPRDVDQ
jgi:hypothetical protein